MQHFVIYREHKIMIFLYQLPPLYKGQIIKRPSASCRSPYVADVTMEGYGEIQMVHAPSLGCSGYADASQWVWMTKHENPKLCTHVIHLAERNEKGEMYCVGIHPKSAEKIVNLCLEKGCIFSLDHVSNIEREKTFLHSRFDFVCRDKENRFTIIEVKNVPCADYEDLDYKERKHKDFSHRRVNTKVAYFPDGYRKKKSDPVSPRALKHIQELKELKQEHPDYRCVLIFVIQRPDVAYFQASVVDPLYKKSLYNAFRAGVEVIPIQVSWNQCGQCHYHNTLPYSYFSR